MSLTSTRTSLSKVLEHQTLFLINALSIQPLEQQYARTQVRKCVSRDVKGWTTQGRYNNLGVCALYVEAYQDAHYHFQKGLDIGAVLPRHMEILEMNLIEFQKWDGVSAYRGGHQLIF